ncbi:nuclear transport factor 2 family protein [Solirubrobacter sp. CPCC 204708]|uniref:Nuclear transport factor 2 family protein n=1 Tax=Solirubrobacter deserti TaxID=2282478 RepID=A0ABT4RLE0_9ACTN|nr:nuclear transport factor 2 family protein [Solirubrobacter deserti]MBE2320430.1 nuclear transport factor 2 family protein [Solirubrobacter deserti]MDA0139379.1 nuclear transport factor 2 family protein [Solirubrobacter deserti]
MTSDRVEVASLFTRLSRLLDDKRWDDAGTIYTEDATVQSPRGGELRGLDALTAFLKQSDVEGVNTQHVDTNVVVHVDGDEATAEANSLVFFYREGEAPHRESGLRLSWTAARTPAGWRITTSRIVPAWIREREVIGAGA